MRRLILEALEALSLWRAETWKRRAKRLRDLLDRLNPTERH